MDINDALRARYFAEIKHAGQTYNDEIPYTLHLDSVVSVARRFGISNRDIIVACTLHDIIEDCRVSYNDVKERFGEHVAEIVYAVTNELGRNRKERAEKTYPKIAGFLEATIVKLSDRIANVEYGMATKSRQVNMYRKEYPEFRKIIYVDFFSADHSGKDGVHAVENMWCYLDTLMEFKDLKS